MKVLHVIPSMDGTTGGPPVVVERLTEHAARYGWAASVLTARAHSNSGAGSQQCRDGTLTALSSQLSALAGNGRRRVGSLVRQADIVHLHTLWSPLVAVAAEAARAERIPYVLSPHGMLDPYSLGQKSLKKKIYFALFERRVAAGAAQIVFTSQAERDLAAPVVGELPSTVISLGADAPPRLTESLDAEFHVAHPELAGRPLLIFLGRLHEKKRPDAVIRAMTRIRASVPHATLLMVGTGPPAMQRSLANLTAALGLEDAVRFLGHLSGDDKWRALSAAQVFLLPSRQENFAISAAEALQAGVPALITKRVNIWRDVIDAGAGDVVREDAIESDLAEKTIAYLTDSARYEAAANAARALANRKYSWAASTWKMHELYERIISLALVK